jgi:RNA polymerase sigma factor (sigma-70 family)
MSIIEFNHSLVKNADYLRPFAISLTRDPEAAKDLLQETMYRALANQDKYRSGTNIKAWLFTIMRNIFINDYRRTKNQGIIEQSPDELFGESSAMAIANNAESILVMKDVQTAIHKLPNIFRDPFILFFEGYRYHEIAVILSEPLGTIKSRIHFARKLLKEQLNRY